MEKLVLQVQDLKIGYEGRVVGEHISFAVPRGQLLGIIGCNGAGKSTLLQTLRGLQPRLGGSISYFGTPLEELKEEQLARQVAYLQQRVELGFGYTALELVLTGRYPYLKWWQNESNQDKALALACLRYTGTEELAHRPVSQVSGGQRQRILLAKVLAQQTPLLFLDEPTTGLDLVYQEEIFRFARELTQQGKTIIMVIHELQLAARYCHRLLLLGQGGLLAQGTPQQVLTSQLLSLAYGANIEARYNSSTQSLELRTSLGHSGLQRHSLLQEIL